MYQYIFPCSSQFTLSILPQTKKTFFFSPVIILRYHVIRADRDSLGYLIILMQRRKTCGNITGLHLARFWTSSQIIQEPCEDLKAVQCVWILNIINPRDRYLKNRQKRKQRSLQGHTAPGAKETMRFFIVRYFVFFGFTNRRCTGAESKWVFAFLVLPVVCVPTPKPKAAAACTNNSPGGLLDDNKTSSANATITPCHSAELPC